MKYSYSHDIPSKNGGYHSQIRGEEIIIQIHGDYEERRSLAKQICILLELQDSDKKPEQTARRPMWSDEKCNPPSTTDKQFLALHNATENGVWLEGRYVAKPVTLRFNSILLYLAPDGTYCLGDDSG